MPITKCWFGISEFQRLAAASDFPDNLFKEACWGFPIINNYKENPLLVCTHTYTKRKKPNPYTVIQYSLIQECFVKLFVIVVGTVEC